MELAIVCDIFGGWSMQQDENLRADKRLVLDRLIAHGFVEQSNGRSVSKYQHTAKTELRRGTQWVGAGALALIAQLPA
jgi:hypothetical protein